MVQHDLADLLFRGGKGDAVLGGGKAGVLGLERDAAHAAGVAHAGGGQRGLEAAERQVLGRRAAVGQGAAGEVADEPVAGQLREQLARAVLDAFARDALKDLPAVLVDLPGADPEAALGKAHGPVREERQHGRAGPLVVGGQGREGVRRAGEHGHGQLVELLHLAGLRVKAQRAAPRQQEELAACGQGHQLVRAGQGELLAAAAEHEQVRVVVDVAGFIGKDEGRLDVFGGGHGGPYPAAGLFASKAAGWGGRFG